MILIDFAGISIANIQQQSLELEENLIRHMILNSIRMYRKKYFKKYGEIVLACEGPNNWRKEVFTQYKQGRAKARKESTFDWPKAFEIIEKILAEIKENFPYKVVRVTGCEGDDVIAQLVDLTQEFNRGEDVMIISGDKDFAQLQKYKNVNQFSCITKKPIVENDPKWFLFKHICRGDGSDGVPSILCPDDFYLNDDRAPSLFEKRIQRWYDLYRTDVDAMIKDMGPELYRNFQRNEKIIDLDKIPAALKEEIINNYDNQEVPRASKVRSYLIKNRCRMLLEDLDQFVK